MLLWRIIRRLMALGIRFVVVQRGLVLGFGLVAVLLVAIASTRLPMTASPAPAQASSGLVSAPAPSGTPVASQAVTNYLNGMRTFDAKLMWSTLSPDFVKQMSDKGFTQASAQQNADQEKQAGVVWEFTYIGQYALADGSHYYFFVATGREGGGTGTPHQEYYVFTVSPSDVITDIG